MKVGGLLRFPDGRVSTLRIVKDPEWSEQWLRRSVQPQKLLSLTTTILPVGENLTTSLGTTIPIVGINEEGSTVGVFFDLKEERPIATILGESLAALQWLDGINGRHLETFARYFWNDPNASLVTVWMQLYGQEKVMILGGHAQVHILSWRPLPILIELQIFLQKQGLAINFFQIHNLQGEQGEVIVITEPIFPPHLTLPIQKEIKQVQRMGEVETFLRSLGEQGF